MTKKLNLDKDDLALRLMRALGNPTALEIVNWMEAQPPAAQGPRRFTAIEVSKSLELPYSSVKNCLAASGFVSGKGSGEYWLPPEGYSPEYKALWVLLRDVLGALRRYAEAPKSDPGDDPDSDPRFAPTLNPDEL